MSYIDISFGEDVQKWTKIHVCQDLQQRHTRGVLTYVQNPKMMLEIEKTLVKLPRNQISHVYNTPNLPKIVSKPMTLRFQKGRSAAPVWTISLIRKVEKGHFF